MASYKQAWEFIQEHADEFCASLLIEDENNASETFVRLRKRFLKKK